MAFKVKRLAREIRNLQIKQPYLAALTANVMQEDRRASFNAGMDDVVAKPIKIDDIRELCLRVGAMNTPPI